MGLVLLPLRLPVPNVFLGDPVWAPRLGRPDHPRGQAPRLGRADQPQEWEP